VPWCADGKRLDYAAYQTALKPLPGVTVVLCWSHARRAYLEALDAYPECQQALDLIGKDRRSALWSEQTAHRRASEMGARTARFTWKQAARSGRLHDEQLDGTDALSDGPASSP
jgi:hypothetical protein